MSSPLNNFRRRIILIRLIKILIATLGFIGLGFTLLPDTFGVVIYRSFGFSLNTPFIGSVALLIAFAIGVSAYLRGDVFGKPDLDVAFLSKDYLSSQIAPDNISALRDEVRDLQKKLAASQINAAQLLPEQQQALVDAVKLQLHGEAADEIIGMIEQKYAAQIIENAQAQPIRSAFALTSQRLLKEISALSRRNNLNLTIGAVTTAIAVGLLAYLVLGATAQRFEGITDILAHFLPRVSVAIFIEVFSFFFLRLYKAGIQEIKYFQNELTNIDMKVVALESAFLKTPNTLTEKIAPELASTDRNQPQVSLSKKAGEDGQQIDAKNVIEILDKVGKLLGSGKS